MITNVGVASEVMDRPVHYRREVLVEQNLWLIRLRWIAVVGIVGAALVNSYALRYTILASVVPVYFCAGLLFACNAAYYLAATKKIEDASGKDVVLAMIQVEMDSAILTALLYFTGGVLNPFFLLYVFHFISN